MKKLKLKAPVAKEWHEQRVVFEWAKLYEGREPRLKLLNASMNGLQVSNPAVIVRAKLCGLKNGYPDIFLPVQAYGFSGLFIELKRVDWKGYLNDDQTWWRMQLKEQNYHVVTCRGAEEAIYQLRLYLDVKE